jgi:ABC-type lipoprotein export system ATPase subunit
MNIQIEDLFYIYESNGEKVVALRGLNLLVEVGECLVIRGPNGSGKSTLAKLLTGYLTPTSGRILIGSVNIQKLDPVELRRELVASIDQRGNLIKELSVLENLTLALSLSGKSTSESLVDASQLLELHGKGELSHRYPEELSSGERQYLSLLAAIATNPKVLIADEPSGELDDEAAEILFALLKAVSREKVVILVSHDPRADQCATRIVRIREGRVSEKWNPGESEESVVDQFGWMRVKEISHPVPTRNLSTISVATPLLVAKDLKLSYGERTIFSGVNLEGLSGQLIALDSTSSAGSGKSSFLRILCGVQDPTEGVIAIGGVMMPDLDRQERAALRESVIGYLNQRGSSLQNISLGDYLGTSVAQLGGTFSERINAPLSTFSGGERARIELFKAIAQAKPILLLDEPTSQMDEKRAFESIELLFSFVQSGGLAIVSTRDQTLLQAADKILYLH